MKWHKNLGTKLVIVAMSLMSVIGGWVIVRQRPPATDASATVTQDAGTTSGTATGQRGNTQTTSSTRTKPHTRTRVS